MSASDHREQHLAPLPSALLRRPLEYILADHLRQRVLCVLCEQIAEADHADAGIMREIVDYLKTDMMVHVSDEKQDFFPLIRRRAEPEDDIETALRQLSGEHAAEQRQASAIVERLERILDQPSPTIDHDLRSALKQFARSERGHLSLENATVLPLAKLRLTPRDLKDLASRMADRRGIVLDAA